MQENRYAELLEDEVLFEVVTRRGQGLGSAGDDDHIGALDTLLLQELSHGRADAVIEAAENGGVGYVLIGGRVKMEDLAHERHSSILTGSARFHSCPETPGFLPGTARDLSLASGHHLTPRNKVQVAHNALRVAMSEDRKSTRLNSSHQIISYAVFCLKKKKHRGTALLHAHFPLLHGPGSPR